MDIFYLVCLCVIILFVAVYVGITNAIITRQDRMLAALVAENERLRTNRQHNGVKVVSIYEQPTGENMPSYEKEW